MPLAEALGALAERLGAGRAEVIATVFSQWQDLVGEAVAAHVRPLRVDSDTLFVCVDHPAWATQLRHLAPDILDRVTEACRPHPAPTRLQATVRR